MKGIKLTIRCRFCEAEARLRVGEHAKEPTDVRYGCTSGHIFALPKSSVLSREKDSSVLS